VFYFDLVTDKKIPRNRYRFLGRVVA